MDVGLSGPEFLGASATLVPTPGLPTSYSPSAERGPLGVPAQEASLEGGLDPGPQAASGFQQSRRGTSPAHSEACGAGCFQGKASTRRRAMGRGSVSPEAGSGVPSGVPSF